MKDPDAAAMTVAGDEIITLTARTVPPADLDALGPFLQPQIFAPTGLWHGQQPGRARARILALRRRSRLDPAPGLFGAMIGPRRQAGQTVVTQPRPEPVQQRRPGVVAIVVTIVVAIMTAPQICLGRAIFIGALSAQLHGFHG